MTAQSDLPTWRVACPSRASTTLDAFVYVEGYPYLRNNGQLLFTTVEDPEVETGGDLIAVFGQFIYYGRVYGLRSDQMDIGPVQDQDR